MSLSNRLLIVFATLGILVMMLGCIISNPVGAVLCWIGIGLVVLGTCFWSVIAILEFYTGDL